MEKQILQIENLEAQKLLGRLHQIKTELHEIKQGFINKETDKLFTRAQTAKYFNVSVTTIWHWTKKGLIQSYKIANKVYFKQSEIEQALTEIKA